MLPFFAGYCVQVKYKVKVLYCLLTPSSNDLFSFVVVSNVVASPATKLSARHCRGVELASALDEVNTKFDCTSDTA